MNEQDILIACRPRHNEVFGLCGTEFQYPVSDTTILLRREHVCSDRKIVVVAINELEGEHGHSQRTGIAKTATITMPGTTISPLSDTGFTVDIASVRGVTTSEVPSQPLTKYQSSSTAGLHLPSRYCHLYIW